VQWPEFAKKMSPISAAVSIFVVAAPIFCRLRLNFCLHCLYFYLLNSIFLRFLSVFDLSSVIAQPLMGMERIGTDIGHVWRNSLELF
jgi:hypothetical protein